MTNARYMLYTHFDDDNDDVLETFKEERNVSPTTVQEGIN